MFTIIAAWLINMAGRPFTEPQEYDEPNATVSNILAELRSFVRDILVFICRKPADVVITYITQS